MNADAAGFNAMDTVLMRSANGGWLMPAPRSPARRSPRSRRRNFYGGTGGSPPSLRRRRNIRTRRRGRKGNRINLAAAQAAPSAQLKLKLKLLTRNDPSDSDGNEGERNQAAAETRKASREIEWTSVQSFCAYIGGAQATLNDKRNAWHIAQAVNLGLVPLTDKAKKDEARR